MRALQFSEFGPVSNLRLIELPDPKADETTAIVKVAAGSITPSDVKNVEGKMEGTPTCSRERARGRAPDPHLACGRTTIFLCEKLPV